MSTAVATQRSEVQDRVVRALPGRLPATGAPADISAKNGSGLLAADHRRRMVLEIHLEKAARLLRKPQG
jgi:hypothetical protein